MRIGHFSPAFFPSIGGAQVATHNLALQQLRAGHEPVVVTTWRNWRAVAGRAPYRVVPLLSRSAAAVFRLRQLGLDGRWVVGAQLAAYQRRFRFDVWHVSTAYPAGFLAAPALARFGVPAVVTCQGADVQTLPAIGYGFRLQPGVEDALAAALAVYDRVVVVGEDMRANVAALGVPPERVLAIPNGADVERIAALPVDRAAVRRRMGWPDDRTVLLTVGRIHPKKGFALIPAIVRRVAERRRDFLWAVVGRETEPLAAEAERLGVGDLLRLVPEIGGGAPDPAAPAFELPGCALVELLKAADAFAFPTLLEGLPLVLVEAMAAGLPALATDAPGCRDVVHSGTDGLLAPVADDAAFADRVLALLDDPGLRRRLGEGAARTAAGYAWSGIAARYLELYRELGRRPGPPRPRRPGSAPLSGRRP